MSRFFLPYITLDKEFASVKIIIQGSHKSPKKKRSLNETYFYALAVHICNIFIPLSKLIGLGHFHFLGSEN